MIEFYRGYALSRESTDFLYEYNGAKQAGEASQDRSSW